jgi:general secretion pathway protein M
MEGLTSNEAANLLFRLEKGAKPVLIKRASLKTRFDDPARLDLTLTVALLKAAPQAQR